MTDASASKRKRGVRVLGLSFLTLFIGLCLSAVIAYFVYNGRPGYWQQQQARIDAMSQTERQAVSESLHARVANGWTAADNDWPATEADLYGHRSTIEIPYEDLNVWLAEEGIGLLTQIGIKLPKSVKAAMVDSAGDGLLRISCDIERKQRRQIIALTFEVKVSDDGQITSTLKGATAGRLPMPTKVATDLIAQRGDGEGLMVGLTQGKPVGPLELPIDKARSGRLIALEVRDDALVVTRETVKPKAAE